MTVDPVAVRPPRGATPVGGPLVGAVDDLVKSVWLSQPAERHGGATPDGDGRPSWRHGDTSAWLLAAANFGVEHVTLQLPVPPPHRAVLLSSTDPDRHGGEVDPDRFVLLPNEVVVLLTPLDSRAEPSAFPPPATW
jgi:hypothetical protein